MTKASKKPKSTLRKVLDWVILGVFGLLFAFILTFQIVSKVSAKNNFGVPNFNGFQTLVVLTDSMEKDYMVGSACFVQKMDPSNFEEGDDLTFYYSPWKQYMSNPIVTHRIRNIEIDTSIEVGKGRYTFTLGGINKDSDQAWEVSGHTTRDCTNQTQIVTEQYVLGKVVGNSVFVGGFYSFITSIWGLIIMLIIPCGYLIISYGIDIYKTLKEKEETADNTEVESITVNSEDKPNNRLDSLSKEDKERLKQELLEQMMEDKKQK